MRNQKHNVQKSRTIGQKRYHVPFHKTFSLLYALRPYVQFVSFIVCLFVLVKTLHLFSIHKDKKKNLKTGLYKSLLYTVLRNKKVSSIDNFYQQSAPHQEFHYKLNSSQVDRKHYFRLKLFTHYQLKRNTVLKLP